MRELFLPISYIYSKAMAVRNELFVRKIIPVVECGIPVVSVGNLTMGGTGKTPIICELVAWALEQKLRPGVVSRGYKSHVKDVERVTADSEPGHFGDEPTMIANRFKTIPVYVGADRVRAIQKMRAETDVQIIFADDAFQHRRMGRNVDVVVIDCTEPIKHYRVLPLGRAREDISGLKRANFIILNKVNLSTPEQKMAVLNFVENSLGDLDTPVVESEYYVRNLVSLKDGSKIEPGGVEPIVLLSGVGNPQGVERLLTKNFDIKKHFAFRDHHHYTKEDIRKVIDEARKLKVRRILLTEKDAVKISVLLNKGEIANAEMFWCTELSLKLSIKVKRLYEKILALTN
jgi:tetraacyldisaccharide 4'-kinase